MPPRDIARREGGVHPPPPEVEGVTSVISLDLDDHRKPEMNSNSERDKTESDDDVTVESESATRQRHNDTADHDISTPRSRAEAKQTHRVQNRRQSSGVRFDQPVVPVNRYGPRPRAEVSREESDYRPQPLPPRQSYSSYSHHPVGYAESEPEEPSDPISYSSSRRMAPPAGRASYPYPPEIHRPQQPQTHQQYQQPRQYQQSQQHWYPRSNPFSVHYPSSHPNHHQQYLPHPSWPHSHTAPYASPYAAPPSVSSTSVSPPPSQHSKDGAILDVEKIRIEAQLEVMRAMEHKTKAADEQKEFEARIRKEAEEKLQQRLEAMRQEEEEARKMAAKMKSDAEKVAREELQAERRAQAERERLAAMQAKRLEDDMRVKIERERLTEVAIREARARQSEEFERLARERMLRSVGEIVDLAKEKMLLDLGLEKEISENPSEERVLHGTGRHGAHASDTAVRIRKSRGEEQAVWHQSERTPSMTSSRSRHRNTRSVLRHQKVPRARAAEGNQEQVPGMETRQASQRSSSISVLSSATHTSTEPESEIPWPGVPPPAPFAPGRNPDSDLEVRSSSRTGSSYISSGSMRSRESDRTYDSHSSVDERHPPQDFYDPQLEEVADYIVEAMMRRFAGWPDSSIPIPRPPCDCGSSDQIRSFSVGSESALGETATVPSRSSKSIRTHETNSSDRRATRPKPTREQEPLQPSCSFSDGSNPSKTQSYADPVILAIGPNTEKSQATTKIDDSAAWVNSLIEDETRHDNEVSQEEDLDISFLEHSLPIREHVCTLM